MKGIKNIFAEYWGLIGVGILIGILAPLLQYLGNPPNRGICVACFERDIAGAIGFHRAAVVQYMRPEIIGFVFGSMIAAFLFKEFKPRLGSAPIVRFFLGVFAMIGALVFLGCPLSMIVLIGPTIFAVMKPPKRAEKGSSDPLFNQTISPPFEVCFSAF